MSTAVTSSIATKKPKPVVKKTRKIHNFVMNSFNEHYLRLFIFWSARSARQLFAQIQNTTEVHVNGTAG